MNNKILLNTIYKTNNYGAILQSYGLYKELSKYGDVEMLDLKNKHIDNGFKLIRFGFSLKSILSILKDLVRFKSRKLLIQRLRSFIKNNFNETAKVDKIGNNFKKKYTHFITGSDQIWNPSCISDNNFLDPRYFFHGIDSENIFAYCSSRGSYNYSEDEKKLVHKYLSKFKKITVREKDFKSFIKNELKFECETVMDPSFFITKPDLNYLSSNNYIKKIPDKYVLVYTVPKASSMNSIAGIIKKKFGLKVILIDQDIFNIKNADLVLKNCSIGDFLFLFRNAEFILTDSFHGTCFSIIYEKQFIIPDIGHLANRIKSLLSIFKIKDRIVKKNYNVSSIIELLEKGIDYKRVSPLVSNEIKRSRRVIEGFFKN